MNNAVEHAPHAVPFVSLWGCEELHILHAMCAPPGYSTPNLSWVAPKSWDLSGCAPRLSPVSRRGGGVAKSRAICAYLFPPHILFIPAIKFCSPVPGRKKEGGNGCMHRAPFCFPDRDEGGGMAACRRLSSSSHVAYLETTRSVTDRLPPTPEYTSWGRKRGPSGEKQQ